MQITATKTLKNYAEVTKPPIVFLLVFTSLATMVIAWKHTLLPLTPTLFVVSLVAITARLVQGAILSQATSTGTSTPLCAEPNIDRYRAVESLPIER